MIRAVLMDIDDTLLDFGASVREAIRTGFARYGLGECTDETLAVFHRVSGELWRALEQGSLTYEQLLEIRWNGVFDALGISFDGRLFERFFVDYLFDSAIPIAGAEEILSYLRTRCILCASSNAPYDQQINRLRRSGMLDSFDHLFISEKLGVSKPSRAFFDCCMAELNRDLPGNAAIQPREVLVVGDSLSSDMKGGINSGMQTCLFDPNGQGTRGMAVDYVIASLDGLREIL